MVDDLRWASIYDDEDNDYYNLMFVDDMESKIEDMSGWINENLSGRYIAFDYYDRLFLFKIESDVTAFLLRWK